jgi:recombination protein RecT
VKKAEPTTKAVAKPASKSLELRDWLQSKNVKEQFQQVLPRWMNADRFLRVAGSAIVRNPRLQECTPQSILVALMQAAQLGLEPVLGRAHLIPYKNNKTGAYEVQFQVGYQGFIDLAERTDKFSGITAHCVYEHDVFDIELGTVETIKHKPAEGERGALKGCYTVWSRKDGRKSFSYLTISEIYRKFRSRSMAFNYAEKGSKDSPWHTDPDEMAKKSMIKHHAKMEPAAIEVMDAVEFDNASELGTPIAFFDDLQTAKAIEEASPERAAEDIDKEFYDKAEGMDLFELEAFVKETAAEHKCSEADVRADALKQWRGFVKFFEGWKEKRAKGAAKEEVPTPEDDKVFFKG